eukprot:SAG22_NODE_1729_length_3709_cov_2.780055_1_plen_105_part_00
MRVGPGSQQRRDHLSAAGGVQRPVGSMQHNFAEPPPLAQPGGCLDAGLDRAEQTAVVGQRSLRHLGQREQPLDRARPEPDLLGVLQVLPGILQPPEPDQELGPL